MGLGLGPRHAQGAARTCPVSPNPEPTPFSPNPEPSPNPDPNPNPNPNPKQAQELHQGVELRYDLVLQFSHAASGGSLKLGPPDKQLLGTAAIERALKV